MVKMSDVYWLPKHAARKAKKAAAKRIEEDKVFMAELRRMERAGMGL